MKTGYAIGRAARNTFLVRERDRRRWRDLGIVLLVVVPLGAALLAYAWVHLEVIEEGYEIARLEAQLDELLEERRRQRVEVGRLLGPQRLEALAEEHGLRAPRFDQVLFVERPLDPSSAATRAPLQAAQATQAAAQATTAGSTGVAATRSTSNGGGSRR